MRVLLLLLFLLAVHPVAADAGNSKYLEFTRTAARVVTNDEEGKLFIVGDVHGCLDELSELVRRYRKPEETLVFVGDLTMKGGPGTGPPFCAVLRVPLIPMFAVPHLSGGVGLCFQCSG